MFEHPLKWSCGSLPHTIHVFRILTYTFTIQINWKCRLKIIMVWVMSTHTITVFFSSWLLRHRIFSVMPLVKKHLWLKVGEVVLLLSDWRRPDPWESKNWRFVFCWTLADLKWCYCSPSLNYIASMTCMYIYVIYIWYINIVLQQQLKFGLGLPVVCDLSRHWRHGDSALVSPVTRRHVSGRTCPKAQEVAQGSVRRKGRMLPHEQKSETRVV